MENRNVKSNVAADFVEQVRSPVIDGSAFVHSMAVVVGDVRIGRRVMVCPFASIRGDEGGPIFIGDESNVQDGVVLHALETFEDGAKIEGNLRCVEGEEYAVYVGRRVSLAHQCQVHGPAVVMDGTFVGMQTLVFRATVGRNCVIEPGAKVMGVEVAEGRYVPAGAVITSQDQADALNKITEDYHWRGINDRVVNVNVQLANGYREQNC